MKVAHFHKLHFFCLLQILFAPIAPKNTKNTKKYQFAGKNCNFGHKWSIFIQYFMKVLPPVIWFLHASYKLSLPLDCPQFLILRITNFTSKQFSTKLQKIPFFLGGGQLYKNVMKNTNFLLNCTQQNISCVTNAKPWQAGIFVSLLHATVSQMFPLAVWAFFALILNFKGWGIL